MDNREIQRILDEQRKKSVIHQKGDGYIRMVQSIRDVVQTPQYKENLKKGKQRWWDSLDEKQKQIWHDNQSAKSRKASMLFDSAEQAHEIFWQCWDEDRGEKLYAKLAKKYKVTVGGIINLVRGNYNQRTNQNEPHHYCPVDIDTLESMKEQWSEKYQSYTITVISPGKDQLEKYDELWLNSDWYNKVNIVYKMATPSVVYHCRYNLKDTSLQKVREYCDSIGIPRLINDLRQYKALMNRFHWLTKKKSKTYTFDSMESVAEFFSNQTGKKITKALVDETIRKGFAMRDISPLAGWIITKNRLTTHNNML
jgi:hypothetical protein